MATEARSFTTARALLALELHVLTRVQQTCHTGNRYSNDTPIGVVTTIHMARTSTSAAWLLIPMFQFFSGPIVVRVVGKSQPVIDSVGCVMRE